MSTADSRTFLGFEAGFLARVARALQEGGDSLADTVVVVPGRRAGRRLLEALVAQAGGAIEPPRIVTEAGLASAVSRRALRPASQPLVECAWFEAVAAASPAELAPFLSTTAPLADGWSARWSLARHLAALDREAAAEDVGPGATSPEARRLAELSARARGALEAVGLLDPARTLDAVRLEESRRAGVRVLLVGIVEISPALGRWLSALEPPPRSLIQAPAEHAAGFDALGALVPDYWIQRASGLSDDQWAPCDDPESALRASLDWLASLPPGTPTDRVAIGVLGESLLPPLAHALARQGILLHSASGARLRSSAPWLALDAVHAWLARGDFTALAAAVRHPDIAAALRSPGGAAPGLDPAAVLDAWHQAHLPDRVGGELAGRPDLARGARELRDALQALCGEFATREPRPLARWIGPLGELLSGLFPEVPLLGGTEGEDPDDAQLRQALEHFAELAAELREFGAGILSTRVTSRQALRLVLDWSADAPVRAPQRTGAIEALGWLELAHEDAPYLLLLGLNDGWVPQASGARPHADPAASARRARARLARDAHALTALAAQRRERGPSAGLCALTLRRGPGDDPLRPSRLLFHGDEAAAVLRAQRYLARSKRAVRAGGVDRGARVAALPQGPPREIRSVSISGLESYARSPYLFYLEHVLKLRRVRDDAWELDPAGFGSLAHDALESFGRSDAKDSVDPATVEAVLLTALARLARERFGASPLPAVRLQLQQLERRLATFARRQAEEARAGWRIHAVELGLDDAFLEVDGVRIAVGGVVDRVDRHARDGRWRILDYKTGEGADEPKKAHLKREVWVDFQLPLYRHFLSGRFAGEIEVGYFAVSRSLDECGVHLAEFTAEEQASAVAAACDTLRRILRGEFSDVGRARPSDRVQRALCGLSLLDLGDGPGEDDAEAGEEDAS